MSFSDLHGAVGIESTSQFAYHLDKLEGAFVVRSSAEYRLTLDGEAVARVIVAGSLEPTTDLEPVAVDAPCPLCDSDGLVAETAGSLFELRCPSCERSLVTDRLWESELADRTPREAVESVGRRLVHHCRMAADGICPECHGRLESTVRTHEREGTTVYAFHSTCRQCWRVVHVPVEVGCLVHPAAAASRWREGRSSAGSLWDLFAVADEECTLAVATERPFEAEVTIAGGDGGRRFEVGENFDVTPIAPGEG